jgi:ATP-dependent Lon protease
MSDLLEKVRGIRSLPIFPLPLVLFPGVPLPLHIFEERYRQMLRDISIDRRVFGLSFMESDASADGIPPAGHVGCVAEVTEVQPLPDGRSNIMTVGVVRYRLDSYIDDGSPYLVGEVTCFEDYAEDDAQLQSMAKEAATTFERIARAVSILSDQKTPLPKLPSDEPERLSFMMAGAIDLDNETKLELLNLRSTSKRLERIRDYLGAAVESYEDRARIHSLAKRNGHGGKKVTIEE